MTRRLVVSLGLIFAFCSSWLSAPSECRAAEADQILFDFANEAAARDWSPARLPGVAADQPAPKVEIVSLNVVRDDAAPVPRRNALQLTFAGGDWPSVSASKLAVAGNWKQFQTLQAELTVDRPSVAYFRANQGQPDEKGEQPSWQRTIMLLPGRNEVTLMMRHGIGALDAGRGDVTSFVIGMFRPEKGQTLRVSHVRLSPDWPAPQKLGWYSPYNHDGYSAAVAREFVRTGQLTTFKVLGTELEVADLPDLAKRLKDHWAPLSPQTIEQVEAAFQAEFARLKADHPKAVLAILRDGQQGWDPAQPDKVYAGWKYVYLNCHGPSGPNPGREKTPGPSESAEIFMRHRSVLMRADLASIPANARILGAKLVITRVGAKDLKAPEKANLWVAEPCNRAWDESTANCYFYAPGKQWKGVSGLYYGDDPDFLPIFLAHGPAGSGEVNVWDFTEAIKFWQEGKQANHGFFLHGDSNHYMRMVTPQAKNVTQRPAVMVIYEPQE